MQQRVHLGPARVVGGYLAAGGQYPVEQVLDVGLGKDWSSFASVAAMIPLRSLIGELDPTVCKLHCAVYERPGVPDRRSRAFVARLGQVELVARDAR